MIIDDNIFFSSTRIDNIKININKNNTNDKIMIITILR